MGRFTGLKALDISVGDRTAKAVLIYLAVRFNEETGQCNPSLNKMCSDLEIGHKSTLTRALKILESRGFIVKKHRGHRSNAYELCLPADEVVHSVDHLSLVDRPPVVSQIDHPSLVERPKVVQQNDPNLKENRKLNRNWNPSSNGDDAAAAIKKIYCGLTGRPWLKSDAETAMEFMNVDPRIVEIGILSATLKKSWADNGQIFSLKYFKSEIDSWGAQGLGSDAIDARLFSLRQKLDEERRSAMV
jgi:hypothetical protein